MSWSHFCVQDGSWFVTEERNKVAPHIGVVYGNKQIYSSFKQCTDICSSQHWGWNEEHRELALVVGNSIRDYGWRILVFSRRTIFSLHVIHMVVWLLLVSWSVFARVQRSCALFGLSDRGCRQSRSIPTGISMLWCTSLSTFLCEPNSAVLLDESEIGVILCTRQPMVCNRRLQQGFRTQAQLWWNNTVLSTEIYIQTHKL